MENGVRIHVHPSFRRLMKQKAAEQATFIYDLSEEIAKNEELFREDFKKLNPKRRL